MGRREIGNLEMDRKPGGIRAMNSSEVDNRKVKSTAVGNRKVTCKEVRCLKAKSR